MVSLVFHLAQVVVVHGEVVAVSHDEEADEHKQA